jgi:hypothetical protein
LNLQGEKENRKIQLFNFDYGNRFIWHENSEVRKYAQNLYTRKWQPEDLENLELIEQGIKFGKDMWQTCVKGFIKTNKENSKSKNIVEVYAELIKYYSKIVEPNLLKRIFK